MELNNPVFKMVVIVAALLALLFVAIQLSNYPLNPNSKINKIEKIKPVQITQVDKGILPDKFPANLPTEASAVVTNNFNALEGDGRFNATREFESKKTLAQNITIYTKYLKDNGWTISNSLDQSNVKMVAGKKDNQLLQISAALDPNNKVNVITMTLTEFAK